MKKKKKDKYELPDNKWLQSHYSYVGNVFDAPEHQAILSKMDDIDEIIAYKEKVMLERRRILLSNN